MFYLIFLRKHRVLVVHVVRRLNAVHAHDPLALLVFHQLQLQILKKNHSTFVEYFSKIQNVNFENENTCLNNCREMGKH